ncbi:unnamed protein product [Caenorhabditis brenneri]
METNQCTWEKPLKEFLGKIFESASTKIMIFNKIAMFWVILLTVLFYAGPEFRYVYRRYRLVKQEFDKFRQAYNRHMFGDVDEEAEEAVTGVEDADDELASTAAFEDSSDSANGWDFGSSSNSADSQTDSEDEGYPEMLDVGDDFAQAMAEYRRKQAAIARQREQIRIAETIDFDEYLLSKGLIDESEFGKTLMVEF